MTTNEYPRHYVLTDTVTGATERLDGHGKPFPRAEELYAESGHAILVESVWADGEVLTEATVERVAR